MEATQVYSLFAHSLSPAEDIRKHAEEQLKQYSSQPFFFSMLFQIIASPEGEPAIKQASAIFFKNEIVRFWSMEKSSVAKFSPQDKDFIREHLMAAIVGACHSVRPQLIACLQHIVREDFPERWPSLTQQIMASLQSGDFNHMSAALVALLQLVTWRGKNEQSLYDGVIQTFFPAMLAISEKAIQIESVEMYLILKTIFKIYFQAMMFNLPVHMADYNNFLPWFNIMVTVVEKNEPKQLSGVSDEDDRSSNIFWKMKKWVFNSLSRLFCKYGNPSGKDGTTEFSQYYTKHFCGPTTQLFLKQVSAVAHKAFMPRRIICMICDFFDEAIKSKTAWALIKPHVHSIITSFIFPQVCYQRKDEDLWNDDPYEYIHLKYDPYGNFFNPQSACINMLVLLVKGRKKIVFGPVVTFITQVLNKYVACPSNPDFAREKEGALYMLGSIASSLSKPEYLNQMLQFIKLHVVPELNGPYPFLTARALWILQQFDGLEYPDAQELASIFTSVLHCLNSKHLPIQIEAAQTVGMFAEYAELADIIAPSIPQIMQCLLHLTNESGLDSISYVMERLVALYPQHMAPFALELTISLRETYLRLLHEYWQTERGEGDDFGDTEKLLTAVGLLNTITTLIVALNSNSALILRIYEEMLPAITYVFEKGIEDTYEEIFELIELLQYHTRVITPAMWHIFELFYRNFSQCAIDYMSEMEVCLDNFISFGSEVLIGNATYLKMLMEMIQTIMTSNAFEPNQRIHGCALMEIIMLFNPGKVDSLIPFFIEYVSGDAFEMNIKTSTPVLVHYLEVILNAFIYNAPMTLGLLEKTGFTHRFFALLIEKSAAFVRVHDKKLIIMAVNAIFAVPFGSLPSNVQSGFEYLPKLLLETLIGLPAAIESRKNLVEADGVSSDSETEESDFDTEYDEDEAEEEENERDDGREQAKEEADYQRAISGEAFFDDDGGEWFESDELEEELYRETPLDDIDVFAVTKSSVDNNVIGGRILQSLDATGIQQLRAIIQQNIGKNFKN